MLRRSTILASVLLFAGLARAQDDDDEAAGGHGDSPAPTAPSVVARPPTAGPQPRTPTPPPVDPSPRDRLASAVRSYHLGQHDLALSRLTALTRETADDSPVNRDARVYIGEIFFVQGNEAGTREAFETVARLWPDHVLDPFRHPPDVCAFYELVKQAELQRVATVDLQADPLAGRKPPSPFIPLGVAQYRQHRVVPGLLFTVGQVASCGLSLGLGTWLLFDRRYDPTPSVEAIEQAEGPRVWDEDTLKARRGAQWAATGVCYGAYALGVTDAWLAGRRRAGGVDERAAALPVAPVLVATHRF